MMTLHQRLKEAKISHMAVARKAGLNRSTVTLELLQDKPSGKVRRAAEELLAERPIDLIIEGWRLIALNDDGEVSPPQRAETTKATAPTVAHVTTCHSPQQENLP